MIKLNAAEKEVRVNNRIHGFFYMKTVTDVFAPNKVFEIKRDLFYKQH